VSRPITSAEAHDHIMAILDEFTNLQDHDELCQMALWVSDTFVQDYTFCREYLEKRHDLYYVETEEDKLIHLANI